MPMYKITKKHDEFVQLEPEKYLVVDNLDDYDLD